MTPREAIENMINEDGYEVYLDIMNNVPRGIQHYEVFTVDEFTENGGIKMFIDHIVDKITTYRITGMCKQKRWFFERYLSKICTLATESEKVFLKMKYDLHL